MFFEERLKKILVCCIVKVNLVKKKKDLELELRLIFLLCILIDIVYECLSWFFDIFY